MITVEYVNENDDRDVLKLEIVEGEAVNKDVEEKVLADDSPYEMVAVVNDLGVETRFDGEYSEEEDEVDIVEKIAEHM
jgi:hypothetical protein